MRYPCEKCEYSSTSTVHLKTHVQSKHENVYYSCMDCDYDGTTERNLKWHTKTKHEQVRYPCD